MNLKNSTIIITGAASWIGKETSLLASEYGATVLALDINKIALDILKKQTPEDKIQTFVVDVSKTEEIEEFMTIIEKGDNYPDALVNNAGIYLAKSIIDYTHEEVDRVLNINIKAALYFSRYFGKHKLEKKEHGAIVNVTSVAGQEASSDAVYGTSKAALIGLTKSNALNFAPFVRVNAVAPGIVDTPMMKNIPRKRLTQYRECELLKDPIKPQDVAESVLFLLSPAARNYTGAVLDINQ